MRWCVKMTFRRRNQRTEDYVAKMFKPDSTGAEASVEKSDSYFEFASNLVLELHGKHTSSLFIECLCRRTKHTSTKL